MPNYKLLALDIDGTTITNDGQITDETHKWVNRAVEAGVKVIFATGRGYQKVTYLVDELGLSSQMVLLNGAEMWKSKDELLARYYFEKSTIHSLYKLAMENEARFWGYNLNGVLAGDDWTTDMLQLDWMKFGIHHKDLDVLDRLKKLATRLGTVEIAHTGICSLEISPKGCTKKSGVQTVCNLDGIKMEEVMAIGDDLNDLPLIEGAGLGVAMGNAKEILKEKADVITDTNEHHGVAKAIKQYLLN